MTASLQERGLVGRLVGGMVRRSVKARFRNVYWQPPATPIEAPTVFAANHHSWFDGYLMFLAVTKMRAPSLDWIAEYDAFPLFRFIGGLPFPRGDSARRFQTLRRTLKALQSGGMNLVLFPEGELHLAPNIGPFGTSLERLARAVPKLAVRPVALRYQFGIHERPEAWVLVGEPIAHGADLSARTRDAVIALLADAASHPPQAILFAGTKDVNERLNMAHLKRGQKP